MRLRVFHQLLLLLSLLGSTTLINAVTLATDTELATAGYYQLTWQDPDGAAYELQEARDSTFTRPQLIYTGGDLATVITGRADGEYFYRVRALDASQPPGAWSSPVKVTVQHHALGPAFGFFGVGALVFIAILTAILRGNAQSRHKDAM